MHILSPVTDNSLHESAEGETKVCGQTGLTYESGALATALRGPAVMDEVEQERRSRARSRRHERCREVLARQWRLLYAALAGTLDIYPTAKETRKRVTFELIENKIC